MPLVRPLLGIALLSLAACGVRAEDAGRDAPISDAAMPEPAAANSGIEVPARLRDLPNIAGIAGNDVVHRVMLRQIVSQTVDARDFDALNAMEKYLYATNSRLPGGTWALDTFYSGVRIALDYRPMETGACKLRGTDFTSAWAQHDPAEPAAYIAEAQLYLDYAWCIRGGQYADRVDPAAWEPFHANVEAAYEVLSSHAHAAGSDPEFYAAMEGVYTAQGRSAAEFQKLLDEGSAREPYYYGLYFEAAWNAMPQWGGSMAEVDRIARYAVEKTREKDGAGAYVRIYWSLLGCGCDITKFAIDRDLLARSMDDVFARTPSDLNTAHFAEIACRLGERDLARRQFARGGRPDGADWEDRGEWERCRHFAGLS